MKRTTRIGDNKSDNTSSRTLNSSNNGINNRFYSETTSKYLGYAVRKLQGSIVEEKQFV